MEKLALVALLAEAAQPVLAHHRLVAADVPEKLKERDFFINLENLKHGNDIVDPWAKGFTVKSKNYK